jgi:hypothetical protein
LLDKLKKVVQDLAKMKVPTQDLLTIIRADRKSYIAQVGAREYECLEALVKDGTINTIKGLIEHGVAIWDDVLPIAQKYSNLK